MSLSSPLVWEASCGASCLGGFEKTSMVADKRAPDAQRCFGRMTFFGWSACGNWTHRQVDLRTFCFHELTLQRFQFNLHSLPLRYKHLVKMLLQLQTIYVSIRCGAKKSNCLRDVMEFNVTLVCVMQSIKRFHSVAVNHENSYWPAEIFQIQTEIKRKLQ